MLNAPKILKNVASSGFEGLGADVRDFLKVASSESHVLGHNEKRLYQNFITNCLHAIVLKLKGLDDDCWMKEILVATTACCEAFVNLQNGTDVDKTLAVPKLVYNIIISLKKQEYIQDVISLTGLLYSMLAAGTGLVLVESHTVIRAVVACLWSMAAKLARQKPGEAEAAAASADIELHVRLWKSCFDFLCLLPDRCAMIDKLRIIFSDFLPSATTEDTLQLSPGCFQLICSIFESLVEKMTVYLQLTEKLEEKSSLSCHICQVKSLYIEHLIRQSDTAKAREVVSGLKEDPDLAVTVAGVYEVCLDMMGESRKYSALGIRLKQANEMAKNSVETCDQESLRLLYWTYCYFTKLTKLDSAFSESKCRLFVEQSLVAYDICLRVSTKIMEAFTAEDNTKDKKTLDQHMKLFVGLLKTYLRELQLILQVLRSGEGSSSIEDLLKRCLTLAGNFREWLEKDPISLPSKVLAVHRRNCGSVCSSLGTFSFRQGRYSFSAEFYLISVQQLQHCNESKLIKFLESIVECYLHLDNQTEATKVVIQALLITAGEDINPAVMLWYRLKKEAIGKGQTMFQSMSLAAVVQGAGVSVPGATGRQLLQAEYQTWRKAFRRNLAVEYHILCELHEATTGDLEKAQVMVDLAANMCYTGYTYRDSTAGEILNKAIVRMDKYADKAGAVLALAFYTKYDVTHNQVVQEQEKTMDTDNQTDPVPDGDTDSQAKNRLCKASFTLESEQPYLPYLRRAVELWEKWFTDQARGGTKKKSAKAGTDKPDLVIDLEHHLAALMECGTRLILMKQPMLALRAVKIAHSQLYGIPSGRQRESLQQQMARLWLLLGRYHEAEGLILIGDVPASRDSQPILQAELCMISGKKEEGMDILNKVLDKDSSPVMTPQSYLMDGTAKRLLSMFLCFPDSHVINSTHQYLLSLAFEAVRSHISVLKSVVKNDGPEKLKTASTDKWLLLHEVLQSLFHLCQLCRFVGLPNDAVSYLREGLSISQSYGLPRWSCEFLFELLRVQSLVGDHGMAMDTVDFIYTILETDGQDGLNSSSHSDINSSCVKLKHSDTAREKNPSASGDTETDCFGFENIADEPRKNMVTPEKECVAQKLSSACKQRISKLSIPACKCLKEKLSCEDNVRHKLCVKAGIVLAEFFSQADMRSVAERLLSDSKSSVCVKNGMETKNSLVDVILSDVTPTSDSGHLPDPQMVYTCLEATCIEAEIYMHQNNYQKVQQIWRTLSELQEAGYLRNILHSNIVMTRLALCQVNAYMRSLNTAPITAVANNLIDPLTERVEQLSLIGKKVSFCERNELTVECVKTKGARRKLLSGAEGITHDEKLDTCSYMDEKVTLGTPPKSSGFVDNNATPSNKILSHLTSKSAKKERLAHMLQTPVSNRKAVLDFLIESDSDEERDILFPKPKLVTPKVDKVKELKSRSKTEPRNRNRKAKVKAAALPDPICKLDYILETTKDIPESVDSDCIKDNARKTEENLDTECAISGLENCHLDDGGVDQNALTVEGQKVVLAEKIVSKGRGRKTNTRKVGKKNNDNNLKKKKEEVVDVIPEMCDKKQQTPLDTTGNGEDNTCKESSKKVKPLKRNLTVNLPNPAVSGDIFDFNAEASPVVSKVVKSNTRKAKAKASSVTKTKQTTTNVGKGKENVTSADKKPVRSRRGRAKKEEDVVELQRNGHDESFNILEISYEEITETEQQEAVIDIEDNNFPVFEPISVVFENAHTLLLSESPTQDQVAMPNELDFEPIEVMRSDVDPKPAKKSGRTNKKAAGKQAAAKRKGSVDSTDGSASLEVMRSGCPVGLESLAQKMNCVDDTEDIADVPSIGAGGDTSMSQSAVLSSLEMMYEQIRHMAWYPQHPDICQVLALQYIDTDPYRAAFLLSDSIAVTFRHQAMLNVGRKVRKHNEQKDRSSGSSSSSMVQQPGDSLTCIKDGLLFDKDETSLRDMISLIPSDWVVVQLSVISAAAATGQQFILTRFVSDKNPLVVRLPGFASPQGRQILKDFSHILECNVNSVKIESRSKWWNTREKLNLDLQTLVENMEKFWLGPWTSAFLPREFSDKTVSKVAKEIKKALKKDLDPAQIEVLMLSVGNTQCARELLGSVWHPDEVDTVVSIVKKHAKPDITYLANHHVVLILDKNVQHLPWESMPALSSMSVSRVPCLSHLYTSLNYLQTQESSVYNRGVDPRNTYYIINPDLDLSHLEEKFKDWFEGEPGWKGTCGIKPSSDQFTEALTQRDLLIYCGHGSGGRYFGRDEIERLQGRAVTILMGCSSGKLRAKGILEPSGIMLSYFMAGCPCMVANLWDVTDKDIDKFTYDLLQNWLKAEDGAYLSRQVQKSRQACKMKYLVGSAPVVYGLPVYINRKR